MYKRPCSVGAALLAAVIGTSTLASAEIIEIQMVDIDIEYDATTGVISTPGPGPDDLGGVFFFVDGAPSGALIAPPTALSLDLTIPGVFGIDPNGDTVQSAAGGTLELLAPSSILSLSLQVADIIYSPTAVGPEFFRFSFVGTVGDIVSQALPFDLTIGSPVTITLSTRASTVNASQDQVESFEASGSGELNGTFENDPNNNIPEPRTIGIVAALCGMFGARYRRDRSA